MQALLESILRGKASMLGAVSGAVAGLVAVTPAAGFSGPMGAIVLGLDVVLVQQIFEHLDGLGPVAVKQMPVGVGDIAAAVVTHDRFLGCQPRG